MNFPYSSIRSFHYTADFNNISHAADFLELSNSTLSRQIKELETIFKVKLFYRSSNKIYLTNIGLSLKKITDQYFESEEEIKKTLKKLKNRVNKVFNIGAENPVKIMSMIKSLKSDDRQIRFNFFTERNNVLWKMFVKNKIDLLVMNDDYFQKKNSKHNPFENTLIDSMPFYSDYLVFIAHPNHPICYKGTKREVDFNELFETTILLPHRSFTSRNCFEKLCQKVGIQPQKKIEISSRGGIEAAVGENLGVGMILESEISLFSNIEIVRLKPDLIQKKDLEMNQKIYFNHNIADSLLMKKLLQNL